MKKTGFVLLLICMVIVSLFYFQNNKMTSNELFKDKKDFNCSLIDSYIKSSKLIRPGFGIPEISLENFVLVNDIIDKELNFINNETESTLPQRINFDCSKNIFLDYYKLKDGNTLRIQSSYSKDNVLTNVYGFIVFNNGNMNLLTKTEFVLLLIENDNLLKRNKEFYGFDFKSDVVIDILDDLRIEI